MDCQFLSACELSLLNQRMIHLETPWSECLVLVPIIFSPGPRQQGDKRITFSFCKLDPTQTLLAETTSQIPGAHSMASMRHQLIFNATKIRHISMGLKSEPQGEWDNKCLLNNNPISQQCGVDVDTSKACL